MQEMRVQEMIGGMKLPTEMPSWWPEIGYKWAVNPAGVVRETLVLVHPNHPPVIWNKDDETEEWIGMRGLRP